MKLLCFLAKQMMFGRVLDNGVPVAVCQSSEVEQLMFVHGMYLVTTVHRPAIKIKILLVRAKIRLTIFAKQLQANKRPNEKMFHILFPGAIRIIVYVS